MPRGQLGDDLKTAITAHKEELLVLIARRASPQGAHGIGTVPRDGPLPLSFFQERLWVLQRLEPESTAANLATVWRAGPVEATRVVEALRSTVRRHEILRAVFPDDGGVPAMKPLAAEAVPIELRDLTDRPPEEQDRAVWAAEAAAARVPFDLTREPPLRLVVHRLSGDRVAVLVTAHHVAADTWSLAALAREVWAACEAPRTSAPALQYADFAAWERRRSESPEAVTELAWWRQRLAGAPPLSTFPSDRLEGDPAPAGGAVHTFRLDAALSAAVRATAAEQGATVYMVLLGACAAALHWYTGQDDLVLGSPMGTRDRPEFEAIVGPFVNLLLLRIDLSGDPAFTDVVARARAAVLDAHEHRDVAFEKIVEHVKPTRSLDHAPLFQVALVQHNTPDADTVAITSGGALHDVTWYVHEEAGKLVCSLEYRTDLYTRPGIERLASRLVLLLDEVTRRRGRRISELSLLLPDEARLVVEAFNATDRVTDPAPVVAQFERQVARTPDACAVGFEGAPLTYRALDARADDLARGLRAVGVGPGVVTGLCVERSLEMVVALLAVHKAGGAHLPLDPEFPAERLSYMLEDSGARALVTAGPLPRGVRVPTGVTVLDVGDVDPTTAPGEPLGGRAGPDDLAYVIYTSGSTGRPKGVRVPHRALSNFLASMRDAPGLAPSDVLAAVTTLSFDIAGLELFLPLTMGARVEVLAKRTAADGRALAEALARHGATVLQATPATWRLLVEAGWRGAAGFRALCGGEAMPRDLADALLERTAELWNLYGPTETTIWSTAERVTPGAHAVSIGRPIANTRVYVLSPGGQPLPPGIAGELWIGGAGVADGYHGRPELTAQRFLPDRFDPRPGARMYRTGDLGRWTADGKLEHLGRLDHQVKIRGFRIELGEIETVLTAHPAVRAAIVLAHQASRSDVRLVAYVLHAPGEDVTVSEMRRYLRKELPEYMIPSLFVTLDAIPLTPNGKVDRAALPEPFAAAVRGAPTHVPPAPGPERVLADIWQEILKVETVSAEDNFFELGGHSLLSMRVAAAVERRLGWRMDPRLLFFQNLRQIAAGARRASGS